MKAVQPARQWTNPARRWIRPGKRWGRMKNWYGFQRRIEYRNQHTRRRFLVESAIEDQMSLETGMKVWIIS